MLKACTLFRFKQELSLPEAQKYWRTSHGDLLARYPFYKRYAQSHPILTLGADQARLYDGLAELWVESTQVLRDVSRGEVHEAITSDERRFIDPAYTDRIIVEEHVALESDVASSDVKLVHLIKRRERVDPVSFQTEWREKYAAEMVRARRPLKLVISSTKLAAYRSGLEPKWDVMVTEWHSPMVAIPEGIGDLTMRSAMGSAFTTMVTREHNIAEF